VGRAVWKGVLTVNDFDYDSYQKKNIARSAAHRKGGSKSRKCSLPHDNLTPAQLRKLNGETKTYDLGKPMTYDEFKAMPADIRQEYIRVLHNRFGVGISTISRELFGLSGTALWLHLKNKTGLKAGFGKGHNLSQAEMEVFKAWLNGEVVAWASPVADRDVEASETIAQEDLSAEGGKMVEETGLPETEEKNAPCLTSFSAQYDAFPTLQQLNGWYAMCEGKKVRVTLKVEVENG